VTSRVAWGISAAGAAVFVLACLLVEQGLADGSLYSDVHVYALYGRRMVGGQIPYRDFFDEYPPLAQPVFLLAHVSPVLFKLAMTACGAGALTCGVFVLRAVGAPAWRAVVAAAVIAVSPLLVGPIFLNAYDLWPAFLLSLALLLLVLGRPVWAFGVLGAAVAAKAYPAAALPIFILATARELRRRALVAFAAVVVLAHLPFAILGPGGLRHSYVLQAKRGLELNSLGSSLLLLAGHRELANEPPGSLNVIGGTARAVAAVSAVLVLAAIAAATYAYLRRRPLVATVAASIAGFVAFDKVFSAQYVDWIVPLAPLAGLGASALTVVVLVLTRLVFSHRAQLAEQHDVPLLVVRNLAVVALYLSLLLPRAPAPEYRSSRTRPGRRRCPPADRSA
jgi:uncharacterized membrane protein